MIKKRDYDYYVAIRTHINNLNKCVMYQVTTGCMNVVMHTILNYKTVIFTRHARIFFICYPCLLTKCTLCGTQFSYSYEKDDGNKTTKTK